MGAAFYEHVYEFGFTAVGDVHFCELVAALFEAGGGHYCEVDCSAEVDEGLLGHVFDFLGVGGGGDGDDAFCRVGEGG